MKPSEIRGYVDDLDCIDASDPERAHGQADEVLLEAVPREVREAYQRVIVRAGWWAAS